jgi:hypothetical protein
MRSQSFVFPGLAVLTGLGIIALLTTVILVPIYFTPWGPISTTTRTVYIAGIAILATLLTGLISGQLQSLLAHGFDSELWTMWGPGHPFPPLNRRWRAILRIDKIQEYPRNIPIHIRYLITGLITTAVVTSTTFLIRFRLHL